MNIERKTTHRIITAALVIILIAVVAVIFILDKRQGAPTTDDADEEDKNQTILQQQKLVKDGVTYYMKDGVTAYLIIGTDRSDEAEENAENLEEGYNCKMADMLMVVVVDDNDQTYTILQIDRNTVTEVPVLDSDGEAAGEIDESICSAYYYGPDDTTGAENTVDAVERLLNDTPIERYVALDVDSIGTINNIAGGVTVTLKDDFTAQDPAMKKGATLKLTDQQAICFVQGRMSVGNGKNTGRLRRQRSYLTGLIDSMKAKVTEDSGYINTAYDQLTDLMTTNTTEADLATFATVLISYEDKGIVTLEGEDTEGDVYEDGTVYEEFIPDQEALTQTVIDLFYTTH